MSDRYKISDKNAAYFITMTVVDWLDVFSVKKQKQLIVDSLKYGQRNMGLEIYCWCLMPSHLHIICRATGEMGMSAFLRDFKKFTSKAIVKNVMDEPEDRRELFLSRFKAACSHLKRGQKYKVWQDSNHAMIIFSNKFLYQKLNYVHNNPVEAALVERPEEYMHSSARNYAGLDYLLEVVLVTPELITVK